MISRTRPQSNLYHAQAWVQQKLPFRRSAKAFTNHRHFKSANLAGRLSILLVCFGMSFSGVCQPATAQQPDNSSQDGGATVSGQDSRLGQWRATSPNSDQAIVHSTPFTQGVDILPNEAGQIWRNYDISAFTSKYPAETFPERQIVDWILRETGVDIWFGQPLGILSPTRDTLRVYQTPEIQRIVHELVDRFTHADSDRLSLTFRLVTVGSPNWRSRAFSVIEPVPLETPGIQAWLVSKENAALLLGELRRRNDFVEHLEPTVLIPNGQTRTLTRTQPVTYARSLVRDPNGWLLPNLDMGQINEGYSLEISPLQSVDGLTTEVVVRAKVDQVEKLQNVTIDVPSIGGSVQRIQIQVPQVASWQLHERFRWPSDQVLLLSCGVVANPGPEPSRLIDLPRILDNESPRADALLFIENKPSSDAELYTGGLGQSTPFESR